MTGRKAHVPNSPDVETVALAFCRRVLGSCYQAVKGGCVVLDGSGVRSAAGHFSKVFVVLLWYLVVVVEDWG
jgi:hypothetical protein